MGVTTVTSNHNVPAVEQSTDDAPNNYSLVNTTEKAVEAQVVDEIYQQVKKTLTLDRLVSIQKMLPHILEMGQGMMKNLVIGQI